MTTPALLARPEELAATRGVSYDPTDALALLALEAASDLVRSKTGRTFALEVDEAITLDGSGTHEVLLPPELPIVQVTEASYTWFPTGEDDTPTELDPAVDLHVTPSGILSRVDGCRWPLGRANIAITYTHGYLLPGQAAPEDLPDGIDAEDLTPLPSELQLVVIQRASRAYLEMSEAGAAGATQHSVTIGSYSETTSYGSEGSSGGGTGGFTPLELSVLERYRLEHG